MAALSFIILGKGFSFTGIEEGGLRNGFLTFENGSGHLGYKGFMLFDENGRLVENVYGRDRRWDFIKFSSTWKPEPREIVEIDKISAKIADLVVNHKVSIVVARLRAPGLVAKEEAAEAERHARELLPEVRAKKVKVEEHVSTKGELAS